MHLNLHVLLALSMGGMAAARSLSSPYENVQAELSSEEKIIAWVPSLFSRENHDDVDYYDCGVRSDGCYLHPSDCTRWILCHNGRAADMACPDCKDDTSGKGSCNGSKYLVYDANLDCNSPCNWPSKTSCETGGS